MKCALCKANEADKKNTHFLTDSIIRSCLNQDGENVRGKGYYFDLSSDKTFTDFNFQQETSQDKLETGLGRQPTEAEIEKAKKIPFSVDYVFCSKCEAIFTKIENQFVPYFLAKFREADLTGKSSLDFDNSDIFRSFFLMQIWRTAVCDPSGFKVSEESCEKLRNLLLNKDETKLKTFPLSITYLTTQGELRAYTTNCVAYMNITDPSIIFMNDFVIQFYEHSSKISFKKLYGINESDFKSFINLNESKFSVKIISDDNRKKIVNDFIVDVKAQQVLEDFRELFEQLWKRKYGKMPSLEMTKAYINGLFDYKEIPLIDQLSEKRVAEYTNEFFRRVT